jgi:hypothetical protein
MPSSARADARLSCRVVHCSASPGDGSNSPSALTGAWACSGDSQSGGSAAFSGGGMLSGGGTVFAWPDGSGPSMGGVPSSMGGVTAKTATPH